MKKNICVVLMAVVLCLTLLPANAEAALTQQELSAEMLKHNLQAGPSLDTYKVICATVTKGAENPLTPTTDQYYINLSTEKLYLKAGAPSELQNVYFSTDGKRWSGITVPYDSGNFEGGIDISKQLNKGGNFKIATSVTDKAPTEGQAAGKDDDGKDIPQIIGANVYDLGTFQRRPAAPKCKIDYETRADKTGKTNGDWTLDIETTNLEIAPSVNKKTPSTGVFLRFKPNEGVNVLDCAAKVVKTVYLVRTAPDAASRTPASKFKKLTASSTQKPTKFKVDYKKEIIKTKENAIHVIAEDTDLTVDSDGDGDKTNDLDWKADDEPKAATKEEAKAGIALVQTAFKYNSDDTYTEEVSYYGTTLLVRLNATAKKPATAVQTITVGERKCVYEADIKKATVSAGSFRVPTGMEYYNADKGKWVTGSIKKAGTYEMRFRNKGKYVAKTNKSTGDITSLPIELTLIEGTYGAKNDKTGVTEYEISDFPRYPGLVVGRVQQPADEKQDRHNYDIFPKDYFLGSAQYQKEIKIDLLGLKEGSALINTQGAAMNLALDNGGSAADTVYVKYELVSSQSNDTAPSLTAEGTLAGTTLTVDITGKANADEVPPEGTKYTLKVTLRETQKEKELSLSSKFVCQDVVFSFKLPTYSLQLKPSSTMTYTITGASRAMMKPFDGTKTSFEGLKITEMSNVPKLAIFNQSANAWQNTTETSPEKEKITVSDTNSADKFIVTNDGGARISVDATKGLHFELKLFEATDAGGSKRSYFFVETTDGNYYPFELVVPAQGEVTVSHSDRPAGTYNKIRLELTKGSFDTDTAGEAAFLTSNYVVKVGYTTYTVMRVTSSAEAKVVELLLDKALTLKSAERISVTIKPSAIKDGIMVGASNGKFTMGKEDAPNLTVGASKSGSTVTVEVIIPGGTVYSFANINVSGKSSAATYIGDMALALSANNITITTGGTNNSTMTITYTNVTNIPASINVIVKAEAFKPMLADFSLTKSCNITGT